jgi:hypothetical protein
MSWEPITRRPPTVEGDDPRRVEVRVPLSARPDAEWVEYFEHPTGVPMRVPIHGPSIVNGVVHLTVPADTVDRIVADVDERIRQANTRYAEAVELRERHLRGER